MGEQNFILTYVQACTSGKLAFSECGPMWYFLIIVVFLVLAVVVLIALRMRPKAPLAAS